jgi:hypothetical protein
MRGNTVDGADERDDATSGQSLQPEHAFVVQIRAGTAAGGRRLEGRVEHVVSGETLRFGSAAELIEFLTRAGLPASPDARS